MVSSGKPIGLENNRELAEGVGAAAALAPPPPSSSSLPYRGGISNTPSKWYLENMARGNRIVHFGLDTLRVGADFEWIGISHPAFLAECERCQNLAKEAGNVVNVNFGSVGEVEFYPSAASTMRNYRYRFRQGNAMVFLSHKMGGTSTGNVFVQYGAEFCCKADVSGRHKRLMDSLSYFGCKGRREWLNRVDIACDVHLRESVNLLLLPSYRVPQKNHFSIMGTEDKGQTLYMGKRASRVSCAVYEKGKLVRSGKNAWFESLWELEESEKIENVYRIEYRYNRDFLREYWGNGTVQLAEHSSGSLFRHGLNRVRIGSTYNQARHSRPHDLFLVAANIPEDVDPLEFNRVKPADVSKASVEDLLVGPVLRALRQFRKASDLPPDIAFQDLLHLLSEAVYESPRVASQYGVDPLYAPF